jgi:hypothetical protein
MSAADWVLAWLAASLIFGVWWVAAHEFGQLWRQRQANRAESAAIERDQMRRAREQMRRVK